MIQLFKSLFKHMLQYYIKINLSTGYFFKVHLHNKTDWDKIHQETPYLNYMIWFSKK